MEHTRTFKGVVKRENQENARYPLGGGGVYDHALYITSVAVPAGPNLASLDHKSLQ